MDGASGRGRKGELGLVCKMKKIVKKIELPESIDLKSLLVTFLVGVMKYLTKAA